MNWIKKLTSNANTIVVEIMFDEWYEDMKKVMFLIFLTVTVKKDCGIKTFFLVLKKITLYILKKNQTFIYRRAIKKIIYEISYNLLVINVLLKSLVLIENLFWNSFFYRNLKICQSSLQARPNLKARISAPNLAQYKM